MIRENEKRREMVRERDREIERARFSNQNLVIQYTTRTGVDGIFRLDTKLVWVILWWEGILST